MDDEIVPADCLVLTSGQSDINPDNKGQCFISTGSLDGEKNFKPKMAINQVEKSFVDIVTGKNDKTILEVNLNDEPIASLYQFKAYLKLVHEQGMPHMEELDLKQFVPRGSHVRNSGCLYMLVLYTGLETKLILNQGSYKFKMSHVDKTINYILLCNALVMILFTFVLAFYSYKWVDANIDRHTYVFQGDLSQTKIVTQSFFSFYLLNSSFMPLDLAVGLEMGRFMYIYFIEGDAQMTIIDLQKK
jgi:phospholipid-transporting ATPase